MTDQRDLSEFGASTEATAESDNCDGKVYQNEEWLREQYYAKEKTISEVADAADVTNATIRRWMDNHEIERRSMSEAKSDGDIELYTDPDWLYEQHWEHDNTLVEMGELAGVSGTTIRRKMMEQDVDIKSPAQAHSDGDPELYENPNWLYEQHWENDKTLAEMGEIAGVSDATIERKMHKHDVETKSPSQAQTDGDVEQLQDGEWLREQYWENERTLADIAAELDVTDVTVNEWMKRHGIERRDTTASEVQADGNVEPLKNADWLHEHYVEKEMSAGEIGEMLGVSTTPVLRFMHEHGIEARSIAETNSEGDTMQLRDADWLREQYVENEHSTYDIARKLGISSKTVLDWMDRHNIEVRSKSQRESKGDIAPLKDQQWLRRQYIDKGRSMIGIADELGVSITPVRDYLMEYDIEIRSGHSDPDHLPHTVESDWELSAANLLCDVGIEYEYEGMQIEYGDNRTYCPDFITDEYVIEVKGRPYPDNRRKAVAAMDYLDDRDYIILGRDAAKELPCDIYLHLEERAALHEFFYNKN